MSIGWMSGHRVHYNKIGWDRIVGGVFVVPFEWSVLVMGPFVLIEGFFAVECLLALTEITGMEHFSIKLKQ